MATDQRRRSGASARPDAGGAGRIPVLSERLRAGRDGDQRGVDDRRPDGTQRRGDRRVDPDRLDFQRRRRKRTSIRFAIEIGAGATVDVYGLQVEAQAGASGYKASTRGGVYEDAHLGDDVLTITTTDVNRHSCTVKIIHANHL